jgi:hypothetical protein
MKIFGTRIPCKTVTQQFFPQSQNFAHSRSTFHSSNFLPDLIDAPRLIQTMCQGHEDSAPQEQPKVASSSSSTSTSSGQPHQSDQKKHQKFQKKQQKQQFARPTPPPSELPRPTYELVKEKSAKIANGVPYVDVTRIPSRAFRD